MNYTLEINGLSKYYDGKAAIESIDLKIPKGCIFGLLGPNGAGKTTLIRIINRIVYSDGGTVFFNGEKLNQNHISSIGYMPEERGLYKKMKVGQQVIYLAQLKNLSKKEALQEAKFWFEKFDITSWWDKKVEDLSKGMQQKIQFIVTVIHKPELLILDEPFSGLDPINTELISQEIHRLNQEGTTVIFSTHNMPSAESICHYIALINKSHKVLDGKIVDIKESFKENIYQINFKGELLAFTNALWTAGEIIKTDASDGINKVRVKLNPKIPVRKLIGAINEVVEIKSFNEIYPSLHEIFVTTVNKPDLVKENE